MLRMAKAAAALAASVLGVAACNRAPTPNADNAVASANANFIGAWAGDLAGCAVPQESMGAPHVFTADGYDQHEAHCTFTSVEQRGANSWRIAAACSIEGDQQEVAWDLTVNGDTMTMDPNTQPFVRCP